MLHRERRLDSRSAEDRRETARLRSPPYERIKADACTSLQRARSSHALETPVPASDPADLLRDPIAELSKISADMDRPEGRQRLADYFTNGPYPRFEPIEGDREAFVKIEEDGKRTVVRFVDGAFQEEA